MQRAEVSPAQHQGLRFLHEGQALRPVNQWKSKEIVKQPDSVGKVGVEQKEPQPAGCRDPSRADWAGKS